jgi:uncharacterized protein (TIGR02246 family)
VNVAPGSRRVDDRDAIRELPLRYSRAVEHRDADAMADLFAPDARFGEYGIGRDGARAFTSSMLATSLFAVILVMNHLIDFDPEREDGASGEVWAHCFAQTEADGFVEQLLKYEDTYRCHDGRWYFLHRRHRLWYGVRHGASPLEQPPAAWPASQFGLGDIPLADPKFSAWWSSRCRAETTCRGTASGAKAATTSWQATSTNWP